MYLIYIINYIHLLLNESNKLLIVYILDMEKYALVTCYIIILIQKYTSAILLKMENCYNTNVCLIDNLLYPYTHHINTLLYPTHKIKYYIIYRLNIFDGHLSVILVTN